VISITSSLTSDALSHYCTINSVIMCCYQCTIIVKDNNITLRTNHTNWLSIDHRVTLLKGQCTQIWTFCHLLTLKLIFWHTNYILKIMGNQIVD